MFNITYVQYDESSVALFNSLEVLLSYADVLVKADNRSPISKAFKAKVEHGIAARLSIPTDTIWIFIYDVHQALKRLGDGILTNDEVDDIYSHIYRVREMLQLNEKGYNGKGFNSAYCLGWPKHTKRRCTC